MGVQSEDDGQGGRRKKKGVKEKIKETFGAGKGKDTDTTTVTSHESKTSAPTVTSHESKTSTTVPLTTAPAGHEKEKKGIMEKIKEKLPGHHHNH